MKKLNATALFVFLVKCLIANGQDATTPGFRQSYYFELGGTGGGLSVNYERLFRQQSAWRYGARIGVGAATFSIISPIANGELFTLKGKNGYYLELGLGAAYFFPRRGERTANGILTSYDFREAVWLVPRIGYRRIHPVRGTLFRVGFTPPLILQDGTARFRLVGGISFGRSF